MSKVFLALLLAGAFLTASESYASLCRMILGGADPDYHMDVTAKPIGFWSLKKQVDKNHTPLSRYSRKQMLALIKRNKGMGLSVITSTIKKRETDTVPIVGLDEAFPDSWEPSDKPGRFIVTEVVRESQYLMKVTDVEVGPEGNLIVYGSPRQYPYPIELTLNKSGVYQEFVFLKPIANIQRPILTTTKGLIPEIYNRLLPYSGLLEKPNNQYLLAAQFSSRGGQGLWGYDPSRVVGTPVIAIGYPQLRSLHSGFSANDISLLSILKYDHTLVENKGKLIDYLAPATPLMNFDKATVFEFIKN